MKILIIRGDINSYSGYAKAIFAYTKWLEEKFDIILGVDIHQKKNIGKWIYPTITEQEIETIIHQSSIPPCIITFSTPDNFRIFNYARNIGLFFWETTRMNNLAWLEKINQLDELWIATQFMQNMLMEEGVTIPIKFMPCPLKTDRNAKNELKAIAPSLILREISVSDNSEEKFLSVDDIIQKYDFTLLSTNTYIPRKGFPVLAEEWLNTIQHINKNIALIIKTSSVNIYHTPNDTIQNIENIFKNTAKTHSLKNSHAFICAHSLDHATMASLNDQCQAFLTCSFGEGFGLGVFENLLLNKPVICPKHTSFAEFLPENYPYFLETEIDNFGLYDPVGVYPVSAPWGVPVEGSLTKTLNQLFTDIDDNSVSTHIEDAINHFRQFQPDF